MVKILLERVGVNFGMANLDGEGPLSQALNCGHHAVVTLLSHHRDFIPRSDGDEFTALSSPEPADLEESLSEMIPKLSFQA